MNLNQMGWSLMELETPEDNILIGRVTSVHRSLCKAMTPLGEVNVYLVGRFHDSVVSASERPATGDFVQLSPIFMDEQGANGAVLEAVIDRRTKVSRVAAGSKVEEQVLASNIDYAFILSSANEDFSLNRVQRFILLAEEGGVLPVVVLSKVDLLENVEEVMAHLRERFAQLDILCLSSIHEIGVEEIRARMLPGTTSVFLGSSGVGKSTLVNRLMGSKVQEVHEIREEDSKGRHTTTSRDLFFLPQGAMIIDTAGLREVQVFAGKEALSNTFSQISTLSRQCRFKDCGHGNEPGCAIEEALKNGDLLEEEYRNYLKLQKEAAYMERKLDKEKASNAKQRWKKITKNYRAKKKFENRE